MKKSIIISVLIIAVLAGGSYAVFHKSSSAKTSSSTATSMSGDSMNMKITANDSSATPEVINVSKGQKVTLTFAVGKQGTYHGGLDFKSTDPAIDSGSIDAGESKSVTFTAKKSFKFTPYWYESNVQKDYFITVNVK